MSQNELALQFYKLGFFESEKAEMALSCLEMMDFPHKESVIRRIKSGLGQAIRNYKGIEEEPFASKERLTNSEPQNTLRARMISAESTSP